MSTRTRLAELNMEFAKLDSICTRQMGRIAELIEMLRRAEWWISTKPDGARMSAAIRFVVDGEPTDGTCVRCGGAPRNASGLCATCVDEDAVRAGEVEDDASQALWRKALDQERVQPACFVDTRKQALEEAAEAILAQADTIGRIMAAGWRGNPHMSGDDRNFMHAAQRRRHDDQCRTLAEHLAATLRALLQIEERKAGGEINRARDGALAEVKDK